MMLSLATRPQYGFSFSLQRCEKLSKPSFKAEPSISRAASWLSSTFAMSSFGNDLIFSVDISRNHFIWIRHWFIWFTNLMFEVNIKALNSYSERCNAMFRKRSDEEHQEGRSHFVILLLFDKAPCLAVEFRESCWKWSETSKCKKLHLLYAWKYHLEHLGRLTCQLSR